MLLEIVGVVVIAGGYFLYKSNTRKYEYNEPPIAPGYAYSTGYRGPVSGYTEPNAGADIVETIIEAEIIEDIIDDVTDSD